MISSDQLEGKILNVVISHSHDDHLVGRASAFPQAFMYVYGFPHNPPPSRGESIFVHVRPGTHEHSVSSGKRPADSYCSSFLTFSRDSDSQILDPDKVVFYSPFFFNYAGGDLKTIQPDADSLFSAFEYQSTHILSVFKRLAYYFATSSTGSPSAMQVKKSFNARLSLRSLITEYLSELVGVSRPPIILFDECMDLSMVEPAIRENKRVPLRILHRDR